MKWDTARWLGIGGSLIGCGGLVNGVMGSITDGADGVSQPLLRSSPLPPMTILSWLSSPPPWRCNHTEPQNETLMGGIMGYRSLGLDHLIIQETDRRNCQVVFNSPFSSGLFFSRTTKCHWMKGLFNRLPWENRLERLGRKFMWHHSLSPICVSGRSVTGLLRADQQQTHSSCTTPQNKSTPTSNRALKQVFRKQNGKL